ncbi:protein of unknown function [Taphrina deformans PYCC 5710]|uniref:Alpha N-terminal protein methyltransferase 1 n=1 Tax=Taphrina deformans (strain PYCC 5710 / ATCC 11124 / CBS 356.35 / IMI 108563 / JCM 9778 / NBRC 8474) TaxID=1097556 RepID=R4XDT5_TAPDE|nr:protein of unknown function [Taphrina deformans PYCC 5710]|eukprot:CCG83792.1 protein of unknown function [Taphrina deformans PYCC 5710]
MAGKVPDYEAAVTYWSSQPTTVDGMLGGYGRGRVPRLDIQHSTLFVRQLVSAGQLRIASATAPDRPRKRSRRDSFSSSSEGAKGDEDDGGLVRTVDCGAGIGRVTQDLLLGISDVVDLVEPCAPFTAEIRSCAGLQAARLAGQVGDVLTIGVQDFTPLPDRYTIVWNQWCLGQLSDPDLVAFLGRCKVALKADKALIFVKENIAQGEDVFDEQDSSWTRSEASFLRIFREAGLKCVKSSLQHGFPKELYQVKLWALR